MLVWSYTLAAPKTERHHGLPLVLGNTSLHESRYILRGRKCMEWPSFTARGERVD
jgi:hypothetical protein